MQTSPKDACRLKMQQEAKRCRSNLKACASTTLNAEGQGRALGHTRNRRGLPPQPSRRRIRSVKPDWRWSGLLTGAQVVRNHPDPPIMDQCPQRPRERILNPSTQVTVGSSPTWSSNSKIILPKVRTSKKKCGRPWWNGRHPRLRGARLVHPSSKSRRPHHCCRNFNLLLDPAGDGARLSIELRRVRFRQGRHFQSASTRGGRHVSKLPRAGAQRGFSTA